MKNIKILLKKNQLKEAIYALEARLKKSDNVHLYHRVCNLSIEIEKIESFNRNDEIDRNKKNHKLKKRIKEIIDEFEKEQQKPKSIWKESVRLLSIFILFWFGANIDFKNLSDYDYASVSSFVKQKMAVKSKLKEERSIFIYAIEESKYENVQESLFKQFAALEKCNISVEYSNNVLLGYEVEKYIKDKIINSDIFIPLISIEFIAQGCLDSKLELANQFGGKIIPIQIGYCNPDDCESLTEVDYFPNKNSPIQRTEIIVIDKESFEIVQKVRKKIFQWFD